jgi:predicted transcriptional regulator
MEPAKRKKRTRGEITLAILNLLHEEDRTKTTIVYGLNLNFRTADSYLELLVKNRAVAWNERTNRWYLTPAGEDCRKTLRKSLKAIEAIL